MKSSKPLLPAFAAFIAAATLALAPSANAVSYDVLRSWTDGIGGTGSLSGTVDIPLGDYSISTPDPSPFTNVNLTMILNGGSPIILNHASTSLIFGIAQFLISATATSLIFDTVGGGPSSPADLQFWNASETARYVIGSDGNPHFEAGFSLVGPSIVGSVTFPIVFGTATPTSSVPDSGSTLAMLSMALLGVGIGLRRLSPAPAKAPAPCTGE
jgi:hypothetical protein